MAAGVTDLLPSYTTEFHSTPRQLVNTVATTKVSTNLELLPLKHLQTSHSHFEGLPVIVLQQVLDPTADKVQALGPARLQRPDRQPTSSDGCRTGTAVGSHMLHTSVL